MSFNYSPKIVTDGLVLYLDAANLKSYSGTGSTWFDLSRQNFDSMLMNGTSFNNNNLGCITFDGINDFCFTGLTQNPPNFSFECIFKLNDISGIKVIVGKYDGTLDDYWMGLDLAGEIVFSMNTNSLSSGLTGSLDVIQNVTCVLGTSSRQIWINGNLLNTTATTTCNPSGNLVLADFGIFAYSTPIYPSAIDIFSFKFYDRELSNREIEENYHATKTRYGL